MNFMFTRVMKSNLYCVRKAGKKHIIKDKEEEEDEKNKITGELNKK